MNDAGMFDITHPALRRCLHPVCRSVDVAPGGVVGVRLLDDDWAIARRVDGGLMAMVDRCPHPTTPINARHVVGTQFFAWAERAGADVGVGQGA